MPYCVNPCHWTVNEDGSLSPNFVCNVECLFQCTELDELPDGPSRGRPDLNPDGTVTEVNSGCDDCNDPGLGSPVQYPKRFDTGIGKFEASQNSDNSTFFGSSQPRVFIDQTNQPCAQPPAPGGVAYNDEDQNVTYAYNVLEFENNGDCPVIVDAQVSGYYADIANVPDADSGGARWLGEVRASIFDPVDPAFQIPWQRAHELTIGLTELAEEEGGYDPDPRNICGAMTGPNSLLEAFQAAVRETADCLEQLVEGTNRRFGTLEVSPEDPDNPNEAGPTPTGQYIFPVPGCGSWPDISVYNAPRPGGRRHAGNDIFGPTRSDADIGIPLRAVVSGSVVNHGFRSEGYGWYIDLHGDDGNAYRYAHLNENPAVNPGLATGTPVTVGQTIGFMGKTGNAATTAPHVHFELHPGQSGGTPNGCRPCNSGTSSDPFGFLDALAVDCDDDNQVSNPAYVTQNNEPVIIKNIAVSENAQEAFECIEAIDMSAIDPAALEACVAISNADKTQLGNSDYTRRYNATGGSWQMPLVVNPNQILRIETRSRFARWRHFPEGSSPVEFCDAGGSARAGKISMTVHPLFGGTECEEYSEGEAQADPTFGQLPDYTGQVVNDADTEATSDGYTTTHVSICEPDEPSGQVLRQSPPPSSYVEPGSNVTFYVNNGCTTVPDVVGLDQGNAETIINANGLNPIVIEECSDTIPDNEVFFQEPASNTLVEPGSNVVIYVSTGLCPINFEFDGSDPSVTPDLFPSFGNMTNDVNQLFTQQFSQADFGGNPNFDRVHIDIIVDPDVDETRVAEGSPDSFRADGTALSGTIRWHPDHTGNADNDRILLREVFHILSMNRDYLEDVCDPDGVCHYIGAEGLAAYRQTVDPDAEFIPMSCSADEECAFWDGSEVPGELMSQPRTTIPLPLSRFTIATLLDAGYTNVSFQLADPYP